MATESSGNARSLLLAALAGAMLLASLGMSIVTVALPTLVEAFSASVPAVQWVLLAYLMAITVTIVLAGRLADVFGHRPILLIGLALFVGASLVCAMATGLGMLIVGRALQGVGGATLMALPIAIARQAVPTQRLGAAMGMLGTMSAIGTALGPSLGGLLIAGPGWRATFVLLAGLGLMVLALAHRVVPAASQLHHRVPGALDGWGALALTSFLLFYAFATVGGDAGATLGPGLSGVLAMAALVVFVVVELRASSPLVPIASLRDPATSASLVMNLLVAAVMMSTLVVGPFFLSYGLKLDAVQTGLVMAVGPVASALAGIPSGRLTDRFGAHGMLIAGLIQASIGLLCLAGLPRLFGVAGYVVALMVLTPGYQLFLAANNTAVMLGAATAQRGMLSGLLGLSRHLGFMTGASILPSLFAALLGEGGLHANGSDGVGQAFSLTFLVAAGLGVLAIGVALIGRVRRAVLQQS